MKEADGDLFDSSEGQLKIMYREIGLLSGKKPDGSINKFKLKFINDILGKVNILLGQKYLPFEGFSGFDVDKLPTASDVVFILSQYLKSMDKYRHDNTEYKSGKWFWKLDEGENPKETRSSTFLR